MKSQYKSVIVISNIYYEMKYSYSLGGANVLWTAQQSTLTIPECHCHRRTDRRTHVNAMTILQTAS